MDAQCVQNQFGPYPTSDCDGNCSPPSPPGPPSPPSPPSPPGPPGSSKKGKGLGGGSIFLLVIFCGLIIPYFVIGALIMKFHYGASGVALVPNKPFWEELPGLTRDGVVFTYNLVIGRGTTGYTKV